MANVSQRGSTQPIAGDYFSDVLCVWAYAGQARIDELKRNFGDLMELRYRFLPLFGDVHGRMRRDWGDKGGLPAYADRVQELARQWDHVRVHPQAWRRNVPTSSFGVHRFLKAMQLWEGQRERETPHFSDDVPSLFESILWRLRTAFFEEALDIGARDFQDAVAEEYGVPAEELRVIADGGEADAALIADLELKESQQIPGSPTLVLNEGRQRLYGNVGYGVLEANVRELLRDPQFGEASWCR